MKRYLLVAALLAVVGCSDPATHQNAASGRRTLSLSLSLSLSSLLHDRDVALNSTIDERLECPIPW
jgi:hypothetical protein